MLPDTARKDFLTECYAKEELDFALDKMKAECDVDKKPFSVLLLDIDHFKAYNDKYGHLDGDEFIKYFSSNLRARIADPQGLPFRFGGDEFVILFQGKTSGEAYHIAKSIRRYFKGRPFSMKGRVFKVTFSGGIASYPADGRNPQELVAKADQAMYISKKHGRDKATQYGTIWARRFVRIIYVLAVAALVVFGALHFRKETLADVKNSRPYKELLSRLSKARRRYAPDRVYLKSGRVLEGAVVLEGPTEVRMKLKLADGEGEIAVKRSDIARIKKFPGF